MSNIEIATWAAFLAFLGGSMLFAYIMSRRPPLQ